MAVEKIQVPDLGGAEEVEVIEVLIKAGDEIAENDSIVVLESDKAAMEIPAPKGGKVAEVLVKVGDKVSEGDELIGLEAADDSTAAEPVEAPAAEPEPAPEPAAQEAEEPAAPVAGGGRQMLAVPDLGGAAEVEIIDILVSEGDEVDEEAGLLTLESDKAAMDVPSPYKGKILSIKVKVGDKVSEGSEIMEMEVQGAAAPAPAAKQEQAAPAGQDVTAATAASQSPPSQVSPSQTAPQATSLSEETPAGADVYAGPAVRKLARELGVDLTNVKGTGARGRVQKDDVQDYVKARMQDMQSGAAAIAGGAGIPGIPDQDFSKFGEVEEVDMSKLHQVTAVNMTRNWLNVPMVTQFDKADVTDLEEFRAAQKALAEKKGVKLTPVPFIIKACALALKEYPQFNVSLHSSGKKLVQKKYVHIGVAVATPAGLMVPVIRNADQKSIWELSAELAELGEKAKNRRLTQDDMSGASFTISSLGALGGTGFTPLVNAPEVAILGVSKTATEPVWKDGEFVPRQMMPFSLTYDHRAVNGLDGGLFCTYLNSLLSDIRMMAL